MGAAFSRDFHFILNRNEHFWHGYYGVGLLILGFRLRILDFEMVQMTDHSLHHMLPNGFSGGGRIDD